MRIPFYQVNAFLYAEEQLYKPPAEYKPEITFENYVKAQVHCCMYLTRYKDRSIRDYVDTLKLLKGEDNAKNRKAFKKVLNYYYKDLSNMLNNHQELKGDQFKVIEDPIPALEKLKNNPINEDDNPR